MLRDHKILRICFFPEGSISSLKACTENQPEESLGDATSKAESVPDGSSAGQSLDVIGQDSSSDTRHSEESFSDSFVLLCCEDSTHLYSTKSVIQVPPASFITFTVFLWFYIRAMLKYYNFLREMISPSVK